MKYCPLSFSFIELCPPQTKIRNAQKSGAIGIMVARTRPTGGFGVVAYYSDGSNTDDIKEFPSVEVEIEIGKKILEILQNSFENVTVELIPGKSFSMKSKFLHQFLMNQKNARKYFRC